MVVGMEGIVILFRDIFSLIDRIGCSSVAHYPTIEPGDGNK